MKTPILLKWKRLHSKAEIPKIATAGAACFDLKAAMNEDIILKAGTVLAIPTGLAVEIPQGYELQVRARSGLAIKHGFALVNGVGTIDSDYRGEIKIIATLLSPGELIIQSGDRMAQALVAEVLPVIHEDSSTLTETERGVGGFGSTGRA